MASLTIDRLLSLFSTCLLPFVRTASFVHIKYTKRGCDKSFLSFCLCHVDCDVH